VDRDEGEYFTLQSMITGEFTRESEELGKLIRKK